MTRNAPGTLTLPKFGIQGLLLLWLLVLVLPLVGISHGLRLMIQRDSVALNVTRQNLLTNEMLAFKSDLILEEYLATRLRRLDARLGFLNSNRAPARLAAWGGIHPHSPQRLAQQIRRELGIKSLFVFMHDEDYARFHVWASPHHSPPRIPLTPQKLEELFLIRLPYDIQPLRDPELFKAKLDLRLKLSGQYYERLSQKTLQELFGYMMFSDTQPQNVHAFYSDHYDRQRLYCYFSRSSFTRGRHGTFVLGGYAVYALEKDISLTEMLRFAETSPQNRALHRTLRFDRSVDRPTFVTTATGTWHYDTLPVSTLDLLERHPVTYRRTSIQAHLLQSKPLAMGVFLPSLHLQHPLQTLQGVLQWLALALGLISLLGIIRLGFREEPVPFSLQGKISFSIILSLVLPLSGLLIIILAGVYFYEAVLPGKMFGILQQHLDRFHLGMRGVEAYQSLHITQLQRGLEKAWKEGPEQRLNIAQRWFDEGRKWEYQRLGYNFSPRLLMIAPLQGPEIKITSDRNLGQGSDDLTLVFQLSFERFLLIGATDQFSPSVIQREETKLSLLHSVFDPLVGRDWLPRFFAREGMLTGSPFTGKPDKFSSAMLRHSRTQKPLGTFYSLFTSQNIGDAYLRALENHQNQAFAHSRGRYELTFTFFGREERLRYSIAEQSFPNIMAQDIGRRQAAEKALSLRSDREHQLRQSKREQLMLARYFNDQPYIGVGSAISTRSTSDIGTAVFLFLLILYFVLYLALIASQTARILIAPVTEFVTASQAIAEGRFEHRLHRPAKDEFGEIATAFNAMAEGLAERQRMSRFVSQDVLEVVAQADEASLQPGGEQVEATIVFTHIRSFARWCREYPPEDVVVLLNNYFTVMEQVILAHGGVIDKFIGDAIMAVFRGNTSGQHHAVSACRAALAMQQALRDFNQTRRAENRFEIAMGIGIASGPVIAGRIGANRLINFTCIGNTVNLAARLEGESHRASGTGIVIAPTTIKMLKGQARLNFLARIDIKGRSRQFPLYELTEMREEAS
jgi:class 3 adenylate cyclase